jgi:hypothetical protein
MGNRLPARELLFGDAPLERWALDDPRWQEVRRLLARRLHEAIAELQKIAAGPGSLHALQAWNELRGLGIEPPEKTGREVLGVVLEPPLLAIYADGSAWLGDRWTQSPAWEMLAAARELAASADVAKGPRPPPPLPGVTRLSVLTPLGPMIAQGSIDALLEDPLAGPIVAAGLAKRL